MKRTLLAAVCICALLVSRSAFAHRIDEYLQATLLSLDGNRIEASMRLIPGILVAPSIISAIDTDHDGVFSDTEKHTYALRVLADLSLSIDGRAVQPELASWSIPQPAQLHDGLGEIQIAYSVSLPPGGPNRTFTLSNRHLAASSVYLVNVVAPEQASTVLAQKRNQRQSSYELDFRQTSSPASVRPGSILVWWNGLQLRGLFHLGVRHIAEGQDHLLFLLALLLPAPLLARGGRWCDVAGTRQSVLHLFGIVTAFTLGHSLTLVLGALGFVHVSGSLVEVLIAVSILVSALHALRPIFPGRESFIAGFFGLIHGLAFAATLDRLGLTRWDRVAGIFAFNLGIEAMQLLVVLMVLPSLLLLSSTRAYPVLRIAGASFAGLASLCWIVERVFRISTPSRCSHECHHASRPHPGHASPCDQPYLSFRVASPQSTQRRRHWLPSLNQPAPQRPRSVTPRAALSAVHSSSPGNI